MLQAYIKRVCGSRSHATLLKPVISFSELNSFVGHQLEKQPLLFRCIATSSNYDYPIVHRNYKRNSCHLWEKSSFIPQLQKSQSCLVCCSNEDFSKLRNFATAAKQAAKKGPEGVKIQVKGTDGIVSKLHLVDDEWQTVYRFKYIRLARVIQKLKIYQTAFTCLLALPGSLGMYFHGMVSPEVVTFMLGSSIFACKKFTQFIEQSIFNFRKTQIYLNILHFSF